MMPFDVGEKGWAEFSPDRSRRHSLVRHFNPLLVGIWTVTWIGFNPSTADAEKDDPTVRRETDFTKRLFPESTTYIKVNLSNLVSTDPKAIKSNNLPLCLDGRASMWAAMSKADVIVGAWGSLASGDRMAHLVDAPIAYATRLLKPIRCLGTNADGSPKHPLYLKKETPLETWFDPRASKRSLIDAALEGE